MNMKDHILAALQEQLESWEELLTSLTEAEFHQNWKSGFFHFIEPGSTLPEPDLLDGDNYPWLKEYSLAFIMVASYEHHQEHLEKLLHRL